jgi:drug/metabolite transporter (DMT)-like permease
MFLGVKQLGSIQTALLGVTEILVAVCLAILTLGEQLAIRQWIGAIILIASLTLIIFEPGMGITLLHRKQPQPVKLSPRREV